MKWITFKDPSIYQYCELSYYRVQARVDKRTYSEVSTENSVTGMDLWLNTGLRVKGLGEHRMRQYRLSLVSLF